MSINSTANSKQARLSKPKPTSSRRKRTPKVHGPPPLTPALSQGERESTTVRGSTISQRENKLSDAYGSSNFQRKRPSKTSISPSPSGRGWRVAPGEGREQLHPELLAFARQLRRELTDAERFLWALLRSRRLFGFKFRRQHPLKPYVLDFYCHEAKLAVELDGGQHNRPGERYRDDRRTAFLKEHGIQVVRFWNHDVLQETESVLCSLLKTLTPALSQRERESKTVCSSTFPQGEKALNGTHDSSISQTNRPSKTSPFPSPHGRGWREAPGEGPTKKLLVIDNYDSFTYNLVQLFRRFDLMIEVFRSDQITLKQADGLKPDYLLISPGPKDPVHAGLSIPLIDTFYRRIPVLGVCLGMQCINELFGGKTVRANLPMHGKTSAIHHDQSGVFKGLPSPFTAARYHSLVIELGEKAKDNLTINAQTGDEVIMGVVHNTYPLHGVQFHPESFLTDYGTQMAANFLQMEPLEFK